MRTIIQSLAALAFFCFGVAACGPLDGSLAPGNDCANQTEAEGEEIARHALIAFIDGVKNGDFGGDIKSNGVTISAERLQQIQSEQIIYTGKSDGEIENGSIYEYKIEGIDELMFGVAVFRNCNTEVRLG